MPMTYDVLGHAYNDDERPAFTPLNGGLFYYHIATGKEYEKLSFDAWMTANSLTFGAKELGCPTSAWQAANDTVINRTNTVCAGSPTGGGTGTGGGGSAVIGGGTPAPITAVAALTAAGAPGSPSTSGTVTIGGGPADKAGTLTITYAVDGGTDKSFTIPITLAEPASGVVTAITSKAVAELGVTAVGKVVTFDIAGGTAATSLDKLTSTIA